MGRGTQRNDVTIKHSPLLQPTSNLGPGSAESGIDTLCPKFVPVRRLLNDYKMRVYGFACGP